ncbi:MAG: hypothetical protein ACK559_11195, partial [bacterium]
ARGGRVGGGGASVGEERGVAQHDGEDGGPRLGGGGGGVVDLRPELDEGVEIGLREARREEAPREIGHLLAERGVGGDGGRRDAGEEDRGAALGEIMVHDVPRGGLRDPPGDHRPG